MGKALGWLFFCTVNSGFVFTLFVNLTVALMHRGDFRCRVFMYGNVGCPMETSFTLLYNALLVITVLQTVIAHIHLILLKNINTTKNVSYISSNIHEADSCCQGANLYI